VRLGGGAGSAENGCREIGGEALADPFISLKLSRGLWSVEGLKKGFLRGASGGVRS